MERIFLYVLTIISWLFFTQCSDVSGQNNTADTELTVMTNNYVINENQCILDDKTHTITRKQDVQHSKIKMLRKNIKKIEVKNDVCKFLEKQKNDKY